jgi:hypothetical protein
MPYSPSRCDCQPAWLYLLSFCLVALLGYPLRANEYFLDSDQVWSQPTWNGSVGQEPPFGPPGPDDEAIIDSFTVTAAAGTTVGQLESEAGTLVMQGTFNCDTYLPNSAAQATPGPKTPGSSEKRLSPQGVNQNSRCGTTPRFPEFPLASHLALTRRTGQKEQSSARLMGKRHRRPRC